MWGWWDYLQRVEGDVCRPGGSITAEIIEAAITSGRRDMQIVVEALFNPIMRILDAQYVGEFTGAVASQVTDFTRTVSSSSSRSLGLSDSSASSDSLGSSGRPYVPSDSSMSEGSPSQSPSPRGGTNKKYTKKNNHKSQNKNRTNSKNRKTTRKNLKFKRMIKKHTTKYKKYKTYKRKANGRRLRGNKHKNNKTMRRYRCVRK